LTTLEFQTAGAVARVTFNRPQKRNAIDGATHIALTEALAAVDRDPSIRVVVLTGTGTAFCAGSDLLGSSTEAPPALPRPRIVAPLEQVSKPVIVAVNGAAVGAGLEIVLCCDVRIASTNARFGLPEVRLGSLPGSGGTQRLPLAVGPALAAQMLLTGESISAEQALRAGLVSELWEPNHLIERAMALASAIAANAPLSIMAAKRALRAAMESQLTGGLDLERSLFNELATTEDRAEGRLAYREHRPPHFKGI
jgi:enoyl-CoA hydratase/carnithine racemase